VDVVEAEETDRCVRLLDKKLLCVIVLQYLTCMRRELRVAAMKPPGCIKTYYNRLDRAHYELLGLMNDVAAGIEPPVAITGQSVAA
jgi:hypothetical protein